MAQEMLPRRLAAILYADVAEYSRLTGEDEDATHRLLSEYLDLVAAHVEACDGRVMHYAGDAVRARFSAAVDALACAVQIQTTLAERNHALEESRRVRFRIGVNVGDVIEDRGDMCGDGVNIAACLESLAAPGGICISESVHTTVGNKLALECKDIGEQTVKNIARPVRAYLIDVSPEDGEFPEGHPSPASAVPFLVDETQFALPDRPTIAVLPFTNMSNAHLWLTLAYMENGQEEEARRQALEILRLIPDFSASACPHLLACKDPQRRSRYAALLRNAGLPE